MDNNIAYLTLSEIEKKLSLKSFIRIHKSFIINKDKIKSINLDQVILEDKTTIPIGKFYKYNFLKLIDSDLLKSYRHNG